MFESRGQVLARLCASLCVISCDPAIHLGRLPASESTATDVLFRSDFESGDLSEWGLAQSNLTTSGGVISVSDQLSHAGDYAALISTEKTREHVVLSLDLDETDVLIRFWVRLDSFVETSNWPIVHIDTRTDTGEEMQLWDIGLDGSEGSSYQLFYYESLDLAGSDVNRRSATGNGRIQLGQWSQIEVQIRAHAGETGEVSVWLDGEPQLSLTGTAAGTDAPLLLSFGSFANFLEPLPAEFLIDDVEILKAP